MSQKIINVVCLFVLVTFTIALANAQTPDADKTTADVPLQMTFVGMETHEANGTQSVRYKLSVTNRGDHPDFLWQKTAKPCGKLENSSRTWVEIFGSPGDRRLAGFCRLRSSEDLGHLWFPVQSGEKGPQCVYLVMTDRQTGKKYESNHVCSRSFTVVRGRLSAGAQQPAPARDQGWIEVRGWDLAKKTRVTGPSDSNTRAANGNRQIPALTSVAIDPGDAKAPANKRAGMAKPDLRIRQFLFPPTNDKALRVHVINTGQAESKACRLVLTVRKINGVAAGRETHVNVPLLAAGADAWLLIDVKSILPNNVSLESTTFRLNVDGTEIVAESNEANNEVWHKL